jgi:UV DNA damage endonuclease
MILGYYGRNEALVANGINFKTYKVFPTWAARSEQHKGAIGDMVLYNLKVLGNILKWNVENDIFYYRFVMEHINEHFNIVSFTDLPNYNEIEKVLKMLGQFILENNIRLSTHPALFNVLSSDKEKVVKQTIKNLDSISIFFDLMGLPETDFYPINIHVGGATGSKQESLDRFIAGFKRLYTSTKNRLVVENDDKQSLFSVKELMYLHENIGIPICIDYLHHAFYNDGLTEEEAVKLASSTWKTAPVVHIVSSILNEDQAAKNPRKHATLLYEKFNDYGLNIYGMIEASNSFSAILKYRREI